MVMVPSRNGRKVPPEKIGYFRYRYRYVYIYGGNSCLPQSFLCSLLDTVQRLRYNIVSLTFKAIYDLRCHDPPDSSWRWD